MKAESEEFERTETNESGATPLPRVSIKPASLVPGDPLTVTLAEAPHTEYEQLQVDVVKAGVPNPSMAMGTGTHPELLENGDASIRLNTSSLGPGFYEIALVRLHSPKMDGIPERVDYIGGRDFPRQVFEASVTNEGPQDMEAVLETVIQLEEEIERRFNTPVDLTEAPDRAAVEYWAFVFLKDVLLGTPMRFETFQIVPTGSGLEGGDELRFVNRFLTEDTTTGLVFDQDEAEINRARQSNPVAALYFPALLAPDAETALAYCTEQAETLLLALSLSRDAGGVAFDVVIGSKATGQATRYTLPKSYVGNLLTGGLSGEKAEQVGTYVDGLKQSPFDRFLVGLYRQARRERSPSFQYVRFWQILELMADSQNFDPNDILLDDAGEPILEQGQPKTIRGSVAKVFALLKMESLGSSDQNWERVNVWFALRSAVAHFGGLDQYEMLSRAGTRDWARKGLEEIGKSGSADQYLRQLREDVKLLLMRRLVRAAEERGQEASRAEG